MPRHLPRTVAVVALLSAASAALPGCGDDGPPVPLVPARGRVLFKGSPLSDALIIFRPTTKRDDVPLPSGATDADGRYVLHTFAGDDGAPAGSYKVAVQIQAPSTENRSFLQKVERGSKKTPQTLDSRFADPDRSGLVAEIKPGLEELPDLILD